MRNFAKDCPVKANQSHQPGRAQCPSWCFLVHVWKERKMEMMTSAPTVAYHPSMVKPYFVRAEWDADALVWVATSDDVPGLVTEADTLEALDSKLQLMVPELLEANNCLPDNKIIQVELLARRFSTTTLAAA